MRVSDLELDVGGRQRQIVRGRVLAVGERRTVVVRCDDSAVTLACELLQSDATGGPVLAPGDTVLVWRADDGPGVVLGRVGPSCAPAPDVERAASAEAVPDELIIEATKQLTLKCGEGSITIRSDGKILIKGKDLVSYAQRMNRVKGGAVAIN
jgi:hypothetical protein